MKAKDYYEGCLVVTPIGINTSNPTKSTTAETPEVIGVAQGVHENVKLFVSNEIVTVPPSSFSPKRIHEFQAHLVFYSVHSIPLPLIRIILLNSINVQTLISSYVPTLDSVAKVKLS